MGCQIGNHLRGIGIRNDPKSENQKLKYDVFMLWRPVVLILTLFWSDGYQIDTCLPFSLYLRHGFRSETEPPDWNRVKLFRLQGSYDWSVPPDSNLSFAENVAWDEHHGWKHILMNFSILFKRSINRELAYWVYALFL